MHTTPEVSSILIRPGGVLKILLRSGEKLKVWILERISEKHYRAIDDFNSSLSVNSRPLFEVVRLPDVAGHSGIICLNCRRIC